MIVQMRKVNLMILDSLREEVLRKLRSLGVMHLEFSEDPCEEISELLKDSSSLHRAFEDLPSVENVEKNDVYNPGEAFEIAKRVDALKQMELRCLERISQLKLDVKKQEVWGDFSIDDLNTIKDRGIGIALYEIKNEDIVKFPSFIDFVILNKSKTMSRLVAINRHNSSEIPFEDMPLPEKSIFQLDSDLIENQNKLDEIRSELKKLSAKKHILNMAINHVDEEIDFVKVANSLERYDKISYLTGYVPKSDIKKLEITASQDGWGLVISDPSEDDPVPTIVKRPAIVKPIKPLFDLLGTVPGYREFDISPWFLIFFCLFWGMIVGDAGYGLLFFIFAFITKLIFRITLLIRGRCNQ